MPFVPLQGKASSMPSRLLAIGTVWRTTLWVAYVMVAVALAADVTFGFSVPSKLSPAATVFPVAAGLALLGVISYETMYKRRLLRPLLRQVGYQVCIECGYDLQPGGNPRARCPECGRLADPAGLRHAWITQLHAVAGCHWRRETVLGRRRWELLLLLLPVLVWVGINRAAPAIYPGPHNVPLSLPAAAIILIPLVWALVLHVGRHRLRRISPTLCADMCPNCVRRMDGPPAAALPGDERLQCPSCRTVYERDDLLAIWATILGTRSGS